VQQAGAESRRLAATAEHRLSSSARGEGKPARRNIGDLCNMGATDIPILPAVALRRFQAEAPAVQ